MSNKNEAEVEAELGRACSLVGEVVSGRESGSRDSLAGTDDEDLLAAVEEVEVAIRDWREAQDQRSI